ncbi:hypothetical protein M9H77_07888 [Catharanthus roseus]|uniref:Uncharacterized protein n=1 Tax=Catharanthus roseus TaxID=4058 RepID=A0ACC0BWI1_CATRO|nr:hypothetical protein M9H77_07888 [Catharanthus roseus]
MLRSFQYFLFAEKPVRERTNKTSVTSRREKVPLKELGNVKLLATLDILNPRPQEGLKKLFSSKFKQPKSTSQYIAKNRRQFFSLGKRASNHLPRKVTSMFLMPQGVEVLLFTLCYLPVSTQ